MNSVWDSRVWRKFVPLGTSCAHIELGPPDNNINNNNTDPQNYD